MTIPDFTPDQRRRLAEMGVPNVEAHIARVAEADRERRALAEARDLAEMSIDELVGGIDAAIAAASGRVAPPGSHRATLETLQRLAGSGNAEVLEELERLTGSATAARLAESAAPSEKQLAEMSLDELLAGYAAGI